MTSTIHIMVHLASRNLVATLFETETASNLG